MNFRSFSAIRCNHYFRKVKFSTTIRAGTRFQNKYNGKFTLELYSSLALVPPQDLFTKTIPYWLLVTTAVFFMNTNMDSWFKTSIRYWKTNRKHSNKSWFWSHNSFWDSLYVFWFRFTEKRTKWYKLTPAIKEYSNDLTDLYAIMQNFRHKTRRLQPRRCYL
jgi:hypothetical protein